MKKAKRNNTYRKENCTAEKNRLYLEIACADILNKKIYVPSDVAKRARVLTSEAANVIREFQRNYPGYKVAVNDKFFWTHMPHLMMAFH